MATLADKYFSRFDLDAIEAAVREAESATSGEIIVKIASHSRNWLLERLIYSLVFGVVIGAVALFVTRENDWGMYYNSTQAALWGGIGFVATYFVGGRILRRASRRRSAVFARALDLFGKLTPVRGLAGVLIFLSLDETLAAVIADKGIASKLPPEYWHKPADTVIEAMQNGKHAEGVIAAINMVAAELARCFPGGANDGNDLPDRPETLN